MTLNMTCRKACGACCIAPSISSAIPGMPLGKPAGVACVNLQEDWGCAIFDDQARPLVCASLQAQREMCGHTREFALGYLDRLELLTRPFSAPPSAGSEVR